MRKEIVVSVATLHLAMEVDMELDMDLVVVAAAAVVVAIMTPAHSGEGGTSPPLVPVVSWGFFLSCRYVYV